MGTVRFGAGVINVAKCRFFGLHDCLNSTGSDKERRKGVNSMHTLTLKRLLFCALFFLVVAGMCPTRALAESGNFSDCLLGCIPGDNECTQCCKDTFESKFPTTCYDTYVDCTQVCESQEGTRAVACFKNCQSDLRLCHDAYVQNIKEFTCPDWLAPKDCPFECQAWNPSSRKCVGAPKGVCN